MLCITNDFLSGVNLLRSFLFAARNLHLLELLEIARLLSNAGDAVFVAQLVDDCHEHRCVKQCWDSDLLLDANAQAVDVVDLRVRLFLFQLN